MKHRKLLSVSTVAAFVAYSAHRASLGEVRGAEAVRGLYDRIAPAYDVTAWSFRPLGARLQERAVDLLDLSQGDTVVDLGCGTGVNLPAVGEHGQVVGVDPSSKMLDQAPRRADRHHLPQVTLVQEDIRAFRLPAGTTGVLATASLEMVPEYDVVIREITAQLTPTRGRLATGRFRRSPTWPGWAVALGRTATAPFGVTRAYENLQPWRSVRQHMDEIAFESTAGGALYLIVARTKPAADATVNQPTPRP